MKPVFFYDDEYIIRAGEKADCFYIIKKGHVKILSRDQESLIAMYSEGAYFGEIGLLITGFRTVYVKAVGNVELLCIPYKKFENLVENYPLYKDFLL